MSGPYDYNASYGHANDYYGYNQPPSYNAYPSNGYAPQQSQYFGTQDSYYQTQQHPQYVQQTPADGERGLLGAAAGGATGAYAGHKVGHGILGAIGGAILGSLTEDYAKGKNRKHHGKHNHHNHGHGHHHHKRDVGSGSSSNGKLFGGPSGPSNGIGPMASSFFNQITQKR